MTRARLQLGEIGEAIGAGRLKVDGRIVFETGDVAVTKAAIDPVWYLPGIAERFGVSETALRRTLFEQTGGMYADLVTRPDIKVFLPPIGGITLYIFGDPAAIADPHRRLTCRVHDECNGSDVFGSDICTCRPYLTHGIQQLMPDILHWLGITRIDRFVSMSDMKYNALTGSGIEIGERVPIPDHLVPPDASVEMEAKKAAGYFTPDAPPSADDLTRVVGRDLEQF